MRGRAPVLAGVGALLVLAAEGCVWLAGLGDTPLPELSTDGSPGGSADGALAGDGDMDALVANGPRDSLTEEHDPAPDGAGDAAASPHADARGGDDVAADSFLNGSLDSTTDAREEAPLDGGSGDASDALPDEDTGGPMEAAAPLDPSSLSGLVMWLDSTRGLSYTGESSPALTWLDQSGSHNDAVSVGAPSIHPFVGGGIAVQFNGSTDYLVVADSNTLQFGAEDFTVIMVVAHVTPLDVNSGYGFLFSKQDRGYPYAGPNLVANSGDPFVPAATLWAQVAYASGYYVQTTEADFNNGQPLCVTMRRSALGVGLATLALRVNGADAGAATGQGYARSASAMGSPLYIGGSSSQQDLLGDIAEVVAFKGPLSDDEVSGVEAYLKAKYGF